MDTTLLILLAALLITFLAWNRARRQTENAREEREATLQRSTFTLEPQETTRGRGFVVVAPDGSHLDPDALSWSEHGLESVTTAGLEHHPDARRDPAFAAGRTVELAADEPATSENGAAVRTADEDPRGTAAAARASTLIVWDAQGKVRAGYIPPEQAGSILEHMDAGEVSECIVLWEDLPYDPAEGRTGLRLLLIHRDIGLET